MTASGSLYPSLGRFFKSQKELADAGCMSERRLYDCLRGFKDFTSQEKQAIAGYIAQHIREQPIIDYSELMRADEAWKGKFDEVYRRKEKSNV
jgi:hypothetical protein